MKYKVKITYPTMVWIAGKSYPLYPDHEVELPDINSDHLKTLIALGYLEAEQEQDQSHEKEVK
jgi:hypothetical protein